MIKVSFEKRLIRRKIHKRKRHNGLRTEFKLSIRSPEKLFVVLSEKRAQ